MTSLSSLTVEELADGICLRAGRIAAAEAELLGWIAEFDRREGWAGPGMLSCAHWLCWRVGLSLGAARERVRVARRLADLPELAAGFADGRVSYSKVRAVTRVAEPGDGVEWVPLARSCSAAQLEKIVRGVERARAHAAAQADPSSAAWPLRTTLRYDQHGNFTLTVRGPAQYAPIVRAGLDARKTQLQRERKVAATAEPAAEGAEPGAEGAEPAADDAAAEADRTPDADQLAHGDGPDGPDVPAGTPEPRPAPAPLRVEDDPSLDEPVPGWPEGTTARQVREAMDAYLAMREEEQRHAREEDGVTGLAGLDGLVGHDAWSPAPVRRTAGGAGGTPPPADAAAGTGEAGPVSDADALLALAQDALAAEQTRQPDLARRRRRQLSVQIDPLSGWARQTDGELLPPTSLRAVLKTLPGRGGRMRLRPLTQVDLCRFDLGRAQREPSTALRALLGTLDGERCRFPGCTRHKKLHAHHVVFWRDGGRTDLSNLLLVCARHHTLIHAHGFQLRLHPDRRLEVRTADGVPVLHHPAPPWGNPADLATGCGQQISAGTLPPEHGDTRLDLSYAVNVLLAQAS